jgi:hypothetical protein
MTISGLIPEPYRLAARAGAALVVVALIAAAVFAYGSHREHIVQQKWDQAEDKRKREGAEAVAKRARENAATMLVQNQITQESDHAYQTTALTLRDLYGPGRVRQQSASIERAAGLSGSASSPGKPHGAVADGRSGAGGTAAETGAECEGLRSDAAVTTAQLLALQQWARDQGLYSTGEQ